MQFVRAKRVSLRNHPQFNERWLQQQLADDPSLLGLGELEVRDTERRQPGAGRLDLLLTDPEALTRYEVEIQLGPTDESHIIRTIEYWDIERRRYPQYEHVAVIVAEDITSRFLNVISLFNGFIPLIAIQMQAAEVNGAVTLMAARVLDLMTLGTEEEDEGETTDRAYWEKKASPSSLGIVDQMAELIHEIEPTLQPKYNKHYIGLAASGVARNFVAFKPRRHHAILEFKIPKDEELAVRMTEAGLDLLDYDSRWGNFRARVSQADISEHSSELRELIVMARDSYGT